MEDPLNYCLDQCGTKRTQHDNPLRLAEILHRKAPRTKETKRPPSFQTNVRLQASCHLILADFQSNEVSNRDDIIHKLLEVMKKKGIMKPIFTSRIESL